MKDLFSIKLLGGACVLITSIECASAFSYVAQFPSAASTVVASVGMISPTQYGYFWSVARGDRITQSFTGTGLNSVNGLDLVFDVTVNVLNPSAEVDWNVLVNNNIVGNWSIKANQGTPTESLSFSFGDITGAGNYVISMEVANEVLPGYGSIAIGFPGRLELTSRSQSVPDWSPSWLLLAMSLASLAGGSIWWRRETVCPCHH